VELVYDQTIQSSETDFLSYAAQIGRSNPDVIFVNVAIGQIAPFIRKLRELGVTQPVVGNCWFITPDVQQHLGADYLEGATFAQLDPDQPKFREMLAPAASKPRPAGPERARRWCFRSWSECS
jgi:ABC-type branched-subunit amino acid transport system substrate-binding protein